MIWYRLFKIPARAGRVGAGMTLRFSYAINVKVGALKPLSCTQDRGNKFSGSYNGL